MSPRRGTDRAQPRSGSLITLAWCGLLVVLASILFAFPGPTLVQRASEFYGAAAILLALTIVVRTAPRHRQETSRHQRTSAPSLAMAACFPIAVLAWTYGIFVLYLDIPLVAFALSRWRAERVGGRAS